MQHKLLNFFRIFLVVLATTASAKIYDCMMFFNEFDVLEVRLFELYDQVDYFVIVESDTTFQGNPKPLFFDENRERFAPFLDKIKYVAVKDMPITHDPWERETHQRNAIMRGLNECTDTDVIILSDVDEIPSREAVEKIRDVYAPTYSNPIVLGVDFRTFWFNVRHPVEKANIPVVCRLAHLKQNPPEIMRGQRDQYEAWENCGWHFNNAGGDQAVDFFLTKIRSFSHAECYTGEPTQEGIDSLISTINNYGTKVTDQESFPHLVLLNWEYYQEKKYLRL